MKLTLYCTPHFCGRWPVIKVILNNKEINTFEVTDENPNITVNLKLEEQNNLKINYFNKKEKHTAYKDGAIIQDQYLSLDYIRVDDILVSNGGDDVFACDGSDDCGMNSSGAVWVDQFYDYGVERPGS